MDSRKVFFHLLCNSRKVSSSFVGLKRDVHPLWMSSEMSFISCGFKRGAFYLKLFLLIFVINLFLMFELILFIEINN